MSEFKKDPFFVPVGDEWPHADEWVLIGEKVYGNHNLWPDGRPADRVERLTSTCRDELGTGVSPAASAILPVDQVSEPQSS